MGEFEDIYYQWYHRFFRLSYGVLKDEEEAKEVLQEVFTKFYYHMANVKPEAYVSWLHRTTINQSITHLRKTRKNPHVNDDELDFRTGDGETSRHTINEMREIIEKLPPIHQVVLQLRFYDNYNIAEISNLLSLPEGTIKSRLHYALKYLKEKISNEDK